MTQTGGRPACAGSTSRSRSEPPTAPWSRTRPRLSAAAQSAWAKSGRPEAFTHDEYLPLEAHLLDSAGVALRLTSWAGDSVMGTIARCFDQVASSDVSARDHARLFVSWITGLHDLGKLSPAFARKNEPLAGRMHDAGLTMDRTLATADSRLLPHGLAGHIMVERELARHDWPRQRARAVAAIVGAHHGVPPRAGEIADGALRDRLLGAGLWVDVQRELFDHMGRVLGVADLLPLWSNVRFPQPTQVLISALVIVADWIASDSAAFPLIAVDADPLLDHEARVSSGWRRLALPTPWRPVDSGASADEMLSQRFDLPTGSRARPAQVAMVEAARAQERPGLLILEDAMGSGKTEAALLAAEILAARSGASGIFIGLPTMATADGMFSRTLPWLERALSGGGAPHGASVTLAHGKSGLNEDYRRLRRVGGGVDALSFGGPEPDGRLEIHDDGQFSGSPVYAHSWMRGRKKGVLADIVVGTIDQSLFGALKSPHLALRHLGLARKVVVLDEIHAASAYMNVYLSSLLTWLGAYGIPTILLSATLPERTRAELVDAYARGERTQGVPEVQPKQLTGAERRRLVAARRAQAATAALEASTAPAASRAYPVMTVHATGGARSVPVDSAGASTDVAVELWRGDGDLTARLGRDLADGGCALVVCNTVRRAQETYLALAGRIEAEVRLMHSRFIAHDRLLNDTWLRTTFGKDAVVDRTLPRVVVATQVAEQSLDIDFDVLVTDLAPVDLVLQRIGRLHRHDRTDRPARLSTARCIVRCVPDRLVEAHLDPGGTAVYGARSLLRTAHLLHEVTAGPGSIQLPRDVPDAIERVYGSTPELPPEWRAAGAEAERILRATEEAMRHSARTFLLGTPVDAAADADLVGWLDVRAGGTEDRTGHARVRDGEDGIEVLLVRGGDDLRVLDGLPEAGGEIIPTDQEPTGRVARAMASSALRLPNTFTRGSTADVVIAQLERNMCPAWQSNPHLAGQLVLPLTDGGEVELAGRMLRYDRHTGLQEAPRA